jgi:hypothetical protein
VINQQVSLELLLLKKGGGGGGGTFAGDKQTTPTIRKREAKQTKTFTEDLLELRLKHTETRWKHANVQQTSPAIPTTTAIDPSDDHKATTI